MHLYLFGSLSLSIAIFQLVAVFLVIHPILLLSFCVRLLLGSRVPIEGARDTFDPILAAFVQWQYAGEREPRSGDGDIVARLQLGPVSIVLVTL